MVIPARQSQWIVTGQTLPQVIAQKYDVELPPQASKEIFESIKAHLCDGCIMKGDLED